jgi:hypothetical protein
MFVPSGGGSGQNKASMHDCQIFKALYPRLGNFNLFLQLLQAIFVNESGFIRVKEWNDIQK